MYINRCHISNVLLKSSNQQDIINAYESLRLFIFNTYSFNIAFRLKMTSLEDCPPIKKADNDANSSRNTKGAVTQHAITPPSSRPNPYCFPERQLFTGLIYNGVAVKHHPVSVDPITHTKNIRSLQMRSDDLIITAFPKCGEI